MFNTTIELNNARKDANYITNNNLHAHSAVVEVFSAMVNGEEVGKFGAKADKAVAYIKKLGEKAESGDSAAVAELNTIRRYVIESPVLQEMRPGRSGGPFKETLHDQCDPQQKLRQPGDHGRQL